MGTGKVLGIHQLVLKPGVAPADFERFVAEEWTPRIHDVFPGIDIQVYKGERGQKPGSYLLIHEIASLRVRDHYYGTQGLSPASDGLWKLCGEPCDRAWNRLFDDLATDTGYTDYYALVKK
jgi:hypothetical protein